ncbi:MAG: cellulose binding domain-containing protein [Polyangiaceae bacterium]
MSLVLGACAEAEKLDGPSTSTGGSTSIGGGTSASQGGSASIGGGGMGTSTSTSTAAKGGATATGGTKGTSTVAAVGGSTGVATTSTVAKGGTSATTTTIPASTVVPPPSGLGVNVTKMTDSNGIAWNLLLENTGTAPVDLSKVTLRYYLTVDSMTNPTYDSYYVSNNSSVTAAFVAVSFPTADHYLRLTFGAGTLAGSSTGSNGVHIDGNLHDANWNLKPVGANDYSYSSAAGYNDKITVYYDGTLVWGVEPGSGNTGTGGSGAGGESGLGGGSSAGGAGAGGSSGGTGSAAGGTTAASS